MSRRSNGRTRLKASLFSRQKQVLSFKVLKGISLVGTCAHPRDIHGSKIGIYLGISQVYVMDIPVPPGNQGSWQVLTLHGGYTTSTRININKKETNNS